PESDLYDFCSSRLCTFEWILSAFGNFLSFSPGNIVIGGNSRRRHLRSANLAFLFCLWRGSESYAANFQDSRRLKFSLLVLCYFVCSRKEPQPAAGHCDLRNTEAELDRLSGDRPERNQSRHLRPRSLTVRRIRRLASAYPGGNGGRALAHSLDRANGRNARPRRAFCLHRTPRAALPHAAAVRL